MNTRSLLLAALGALTMGTSLLALQQTQRIPLVPDLTPNRYERLGILLGSHVTLTNQSTVTIRGGAFVDAVNVEVCAPSGIFRVPVTDDRFTAVVPLLENRVNQIFFTALDSAETTGTSVTTFVTMDVQPPNVFLDFPLDGAQITTNVTDVAGRVGDTLSGFESLMVDVNGVPAVVDVGVGTNGTFFAADVPLLPGQSNVLVATATDTLGNQATTEITVEQIVIGPGVPSMTVVSGNGQSGMVGTELTNPVVVEVRDGSGQPFQNKIVSLRVTQSDGLLSMTSGGQAARRLQVRTDSSGLVTAFWTLGSDAGSGNNRLEATSMNIAGTVFFCASGTAAPAAQIAIGMGNNQMGETGGALAEPLRVWVHDNRNPVPGIVVVFQVTGGGGTLSGAAMQTAITDVTGHAAVDFVLGSVPGLNRVEATFAGNPGASSKFVATGIERNPNARTVFRGIVLNNSREPLEGAVVELKIGSDIIETTVSDVEGEFAFNDLAHGGVGDLSVDGETVIRKGGPGGTAVPFGSFPALHFEPVIVIEGAENGLGRPVLLPPLDPLNAQTFDASQDVVLTIRGEGATGQPVEIFEGLAFTIAADTTVTLRDGTRIGPNDPGAVTVQLNQVHSDDIPMPMPDGASPPFAWTIKPTGATFEPPIQLSIPNMAARPPGEIMYFLSFDHDTNRFEIIATGRVSEDGQMLVSDPGSGIVHAGWGGFCPPYPMTGEVDKDPDDGKDEPVDEDEEKPENPPGTPNPEEIKRHCPKDEKLDPVYLFSGEFYEECEDLRIKGRGLDFVWARKYRSKTGPMSAQGNQWDCSYNIFLTPDGPDFLLCDGNSRADTYRFRTNGTWSKQGYFRELVQNPDTSYTLMFESTGRWNFNPLNGSPGAGRISEIVDRNGNTIAFAYDGAGRLQTVTDTLNRDIQIAYNADGFIDTVTDFTGRQVRYDYYQNADVGGSFGDLKSVRTPTVTMTPTGNDFPNGKTTVYTYSEGFSDRRLNSNLLSIRDPEGQVYLQNVYAATQNPADLDYDRIVRQVWGNAGDIIDVTYEAMNPTQQNGFAIVKTIVNDRVGNVGEFFFDDKNVGVMERLYTGRANPNAPTTSSSNRPSGKLRASDPDFFERRQTWNKERKLTSVTEPDGSRTVYIYEGDLDKGAAPRRRGNLRVRVEVRGASNADGDQTSISEILEYDDDFGSGCCGSQFVTRIVDGRGNQSLYEYDAQGNHIRTIDRIPSIVTDYTYNAFGQVTSRMMPGNDSGYRRVDTFAYHANGQQRGYLREIVVDSGGTNLTTSFEYDAVGNMTRIIDPRGNDVVQVFNDLDQLIRYIEREVEPSAPQRYEVDLFYDANDNIVRIDRLNVDETGTVVSANDYLSTLFEYEILNEPIRVCHESGVFDVPRSPLQLNCSGLPDSEFLSNVHAYDENRNRTRTSLGEAAEGRDPNNALEFQYDERDLEFRVVRGPGSPDQSTTQIDYDRNGNITLVSQGLEGTPRRVQGEYDYYDRLTRVTDPIGNVIAFSYDGNGNVVRSEHFGELIDGPGSGGNIPMGRTSYEYDGVDRTTREVRSYFDTATGNPIQGGQANGESELRYEYSDANLLERVVNDNGNDLVYTYDTVYRLATVVDAKGNSQTRAYDANLNLVALTEVDVSDIAGAPNETFVTTMTYDGLDRRTSLTDAVGGTGGGATGNTLTYAYDSRGNLVQYVDALGNVTACEYDSVDREIAVRRLLTADGTGGSAVTGEIFTQRSWDDSFRLRSRTESPVPPATLGNETRFAYDSLDRLIVSRFADGRTPMIGTGASWALGSAEPNLAAFTNGHDVHDNILLKRDANGTVVSSMFDLANRRTGVSVTPGSGVSPATTFENFVYDGRSRIVRAENDGSVVTRAHDSLSNITSETLNGQTLTGQYDGVRNPILHVYPGGRAIANTFDEVERIRTITDVTGAGSTFVSGYDYVGRRRVAGRDHGNNTRVDYTYDGIAGVANPAGDFGERRMIESRHVFDPGGANSVIDQRAYTWDRMGDKSLRRDTRPGGTGLTHTYDYDSVYRLGQSTSLTAAMAVLRDVQYDFDDVGNRRTVTGGMRPGNYVQNTALPSPGDGQMNQYSSTSFDTRRYDDNGNLTHHAPGVIAQPNVDFDYRNRMVEYQSPSSAERHEYTYDAIGRRIERIVDAGGSPVVTRYFYDDWRVCEEQDGVGATTATYVFGRGIDEVVEMQRGGTSYYYHCDDLMSIVALTDASGAVVERYEYDDYGEPVDPTTLGALAGPASSVGNPYLFQGRRLDPETGWYHFRTRYLDPIAGRFVSRDLIGPWGDPKNHGNAFSFAGNNPTSRMDPYGLDGVGLVGATIGAVGGVRSASGSGATTSEQSVDLTKSFINMNQAFAAGAQILENREAARQSSRAFQAMNQAFDPQTGKFANSAAANKALENADKAKARGAGAKKTGKALGAASHVMTVVQSVQRQNKINDESDARHGDNQSGYGRTQAMLDKMKKKALCQKAKGHITQEELIKRLERITKVQKEAAKAYQEGEENAELIQVLETINNMAESATDVSGAGGFVKAARDFIGSIVN